MKERVKERLKKLGPGIITGGAGDDPAGILTYTIVGATTGFSQLWLLLLSTPMMIAVQNTAAKLALVTGKSLPEILSKFYPKKFTYGIVLLLSVANILTIGADLEAVASIFQILTGVKSIYYLVPITALIAYLVTFKRYRTVKKVLIGLTSILSLYILSAIMSKPHVKSLLLSTFIPHIDFKIAFLLSALGLLGTTISPYMIFWQASEEKEEHATVAQAKVAEWDTILGMVYSNIIAYAIIVSSAVMLHNQKNIEEISDAALALKPVAGEYAFLIFSLGVLVSGFLAVPVLAGSTAYAVADTFGWREGLENRVSDARGFYFVFLSSLLIGDFIDFSPISAVDALFYSQVLDGILLPVMSFLLLILGNNRKILGEQKNKLPTNVLLLLTLITSFSATVYLLSNIL
ncbi:NRAMP (natural resistance-associated macrophage protein) metal ion transporters [Balnearium lithotrophicum]|uniref:NRAMP (Natural resistance-associated macrophage protein) metal ion transporters n=1 Tax=Balnearium lithotrophicum TaxID=223788 RepID=A0A521AXZ4_9BACT|nr:Nramp family divalent metal transporter [Balnearium lithotrophicum]SMO39708.1 NRAMP (natural resistance-associated macrophage protein) metal ion transporters [Balnearium lithotrophicum]